MTDKQSVVDYPLYVAGKAVTTGQWLEVYDKYNNTVYARVALADAKVLEKAIAASVKAEAEMAALKPFQKQKILLHCVKRFNELRDELTEILIAEGGKPRGAASAEVERLINTFQLAADAVTQLDDGQLIPLVTDDRFKLLSFTGSDQVGWDMKARAGRKKVTLELGGNAAVLIDADTTLDDALIDRLISAAYGHAGQVCISVQRILVHADLYAELKKKLVAKLKKIKADDPALSTTLVGPMIKEAEALRLKKWIDKAEKKGAKVLLGGSLQGMLFEPVLLENVDAKLEIYKDEAFGPVAILEKFKQFEQGIATINQSRFGLQAGVYTQNLNNMLYAWDHLQVGGVIINDVPTFRVDNMPYGGVKDSGLGREGIHSAIRDMQEQRLLAIKQ